jgi:hypothetical protein
MLVRSVPPIPARPPLAPRWRPGVVGPPAVASIVAERTLSGSDSRLPPQSEEGAMARTDASVSKERRRRRWEDDARVRIEALSVRRLLAVAVAYVVGLAAPDTWAGMAEAGVVVGKGWLKWMTCELDCCECWFVVVWLLPPFGASVCMVVRVVVRDRTDGAGEEKVLSPPLRQLAVRLVPASDDSTCEGAVMERRVSCSVDTVGAIERPPVARGD